MKRRDIRFATKFAPAADRFQLAHNAGFRHAELHLKRSTLEHWQPVAWLASDYPLSYALHFPNAGSLPDHALANAVRLYHELGCQAMVIHPPRIVEFGQILRALLPSIRLGVENQRLNALEFEAWAAENEFLTLDVEHLWKYTLCDQPLENLVVFLDRFLTRYRSKLIHVHLPGYVPGSLEHHPASRNPALVRAVWELLFQAKFFGLVVSESRPSLQTRRNLERDHALFATWAGLPFAGLAPKV